MAPKAIASASSTPVASGAFYADSVGTLNANGYLKISLALPANSVASLVGGGEVAGSEVFKITLDANGIPAAGQSMFMSDQFSSPISPGFNIEIHNSNDRTIGVISNAIISGTAPVDLTNLTAVSAVASFPSPSPTSTGVAFSATPVFAVPSGLQSSVLFTITLAGNVTSSTFSGAVAGQIITFKIIQDSTGSRTFVWPTNVKNAQSPDPTANSINVQSFSFDGTNAYPLGGMTVN